jgi:CheY-like chemotaxis protein
MASQFPHPRTIILVVEDEPILRMMAVDLVEEAGFEAVTAADAEEAISILSSRGDIQIVFTDIDMPRGIDGLRLAALIRDRWPPIEIIITSGKVKPEDAALPGGSLFIPKPYRHAALVDEFRRVASRLN